MLNLMEKKLTDRDNMYELIANNTMSLKTINSAISNNKNTLKQSNQNTQDITRTDLTLSMMENTKYFENQDVNSKMIINDIKEKRKLESVKNNLQNQY
jgi:hypothetical protein